MATNNADQLTAVPQADGQAFSRARLSDSHGRVVEYLRLSVTDRCGMRCAYCVPAGRRNAPACHMLKLRDLLRIVRVFAMAGIRKLRITGGEPLTRKGIVRFIGQCASTPGIERVALTTNGARLAVMAADLKSAGLKAVNVSLDSLDKARFRRITGTDRLDDVLRGVDAALSAGIGSVKLNMVVLRGVNDHEVADLASFAAVRGVQARFIEYMPSPGGFWDNARFMPASEIEAILARRFDLVPAGREPMGGPARIFRLGNGPGEIGIISAVSRHFCGDCNRLRVTSSGKLMTCLFGGEGLDLDRMMKSGASDGEMIQALTLAIKSKKAEGPILESVGKGGLMMNSIGG